MKKRSNLIPCKILVNTSERSSDVVQEYNNEVKAREDLKPEFVDGYIPANHVIAFYASYEYPYQTIVHTGNECLCVKIEVKDFEILYNRHNH